MGGVASRKTGGRDRIAQKREMKRGVDRPLFCRARGEQKSIWREKKGKHLPKTRGRREKDKPVNSGGILKRTKRRREGGLQLFLRKGGPKR